MGRSRDDDDFDITDPHGLFKEACSKLDLEGFSGHFGSVVRIGPSAIPLPSSDHIPFMSRPFHRREEREATRLRADPPEILK